MEIVKNLSFLNEFLPWLLLAFFVIVMFIRNTSQKSCIGSQKSTDAFKLQKEANHHLHILVNEMRRNNRLLSELVMIDPEEASTDHSLQTLNQEKNNEETQDMLETQYKLYVGNIDYAVTETELAEHFNQYGKVEFVNIPVHRYTGKARGFGFVTFGNREEAERAMNALNDSEFKGRKIQVNFAKERE